MSSKRIRPRERDSIIQSLRAGVTPRLGIQHIQVGRAQEIQALYRDIERMIDGGSAFRLIIGAYGSGKTFFLAVIRSLALEKRMVTVHADLSPERRIYSSSGHARHLYSELMRNLSTRTKPDGNALSSVVERFITQAIKQAQEEGCHVSEVIHEKLNKLSEMVGGYDFASVIDAYWKGHEQGNDELKSRAIRWLRAEYSTKTDARRDLGVRTIIDDANFYDSLKLMSLFVREAGYSGLLVCLDEMVNLYKLNSTQARASNYEQILRMLNDCLQGTVEGLGFLLGGTPEFLLDPRKGLYSYEALQSRLAENTFSKRIGVIDYTSPVLHLASLTQEELFILLKNLRHVYASGDSDQYLVSNDMLMSFMQHCFNNIGADYFRTPRSIIKAFIDILSTLEQNPQIHWSQLINEIQLEEDRPSDDMTDFDEGLSDGVSDSEKDGLTGFRL